MASSLFLPSSNASPLIDGNTSLTAGGTVGEGPLSAPASVIPMKEKKLTSLQRKRLEKEQKAVQKRALLVRRRLEPLAKESTLQELEEALYLLKKEKEEALSLQESHELVAEGIPEDVPPLIITFQEKRIALLVEIFSDVASGGAFVDETLNIYSRRSTSGLSYETRHLGVNKSILRAASNVFDQVFDGTFDNTVECDDYNEDSDLEWDDDNDTDETQSVIEVSPSSHCMRDSDHAVSSPNCRRVEDEFTAAPLFDLSDIDNISISDTEIENTTTIDQSSESRDHERDSIHQHHDIQALSKALEPPSPVVLPQRILPDAYRTWKAMYIYLLTDEIKFRPLRSQQEEFLKDENKNSSLHCSPKSMYRLADKLNLRELKQCSFEAISKSFVAHNIVEELFSDFTWRYPEILRLATDGYYRHCTNPQVIEEMEKIHKEIAIGKLGLRASIVLNAINRKFVAMAKA
ncbi:hypothetical protein ABKN59_004837 [Abortiporus biennis]